MESHEIKPIIEAMIFVSQEPLSEQMILTALAESGVEKAQVRECVAAIEQEWNENEERGIALARVAGGLQFRTKERCVEWLRKLSLPKPMRLSAPALETLAIVAYRQPILRSEIEKIRGVDTGGVLKTLLERRLLRIVGRSQEPGQPLLYGTTKEFLEIFNLNTLKELPTLKDIDDLMRERRAQMQGETTKAEGNGEELTEILSEEEEEETEIIKRRPLDEDEEEEKKDMEALSELETQLKGLRRMEKAMFPKARPQADAAAEEETLEAQGGDSHADEAGQEAGEELAAEGADAEANGEEAGSEEIFPPAADEASGEDAPAEDDRAG